MRVLAGGLRRQLLERTDIVHDVEAAPVRRDHQVVVPRLDDDIVHGHRREPRVLHKAPATVETHEHAELGAGEQ